MAKAKKKKQRKTKKEPINYKCLCGSDLWRFENVIEFTQRVADDVYVGVSFCPELECACCGSTITFNTSMTINDVERRTKKKRGT